MNKRIKELADKAGFPVYDKHYAYIEGEFIEKFAELIVKECAEFARQHNLQKADRSHMIHREMKEHFGVEQ